jgi:outer membrane protein insertion porin family
MGDPRPTSSTSRSHRCGIRVLGFALVLAYGLQIPLAAQSELIGLPITEVVIEQEGRAVTEPLLLGLVETRVGEPLNMHDVRQTIDHLFGLARFDDVQVTSERSGTGVRVKYLLVPRHAVERVEFRGSLGLSAGDLRQVVSERFGTRPPASRANDVARALNDTYRERGFVRARVTPRIEEYHDPDRAVMVFEIDAGPRALIQRVEVEGLEATDRLGLQSELDLQPGRPYDGEAIQRRLQRYVDDLRSRGYYEARASHRPDYTPDGQAVVVLSVERGSHFSIAFAGDPLPANVRDELVPLRREGSVDQDLLEDAANALRDHLRAQGYRDADAHFTREPKGEELIITFTITRGARHVIDSIDIKGETAVTNAELRKLLRAETGQPFEQATFDRFVSAATQIYRTRGFTKAKLEPVVAVLPRAEGSPAAERRVKVSITVSEGPRTLVGTITLQGNTVLSNDNVRSMMTLEPNRPYSEVELVQDREKIELEYLNRGYQAVVVQPRVTFAESDTRADVRIAITEGPQVLVDHIIIIGNERTNTRTIQRAILLEAGKPFGYSARLESQQKLVALGLFRHVEITELRHGSEPRRDVLVRVEEAPPTTIGYGGGVEGGTRLRPTGVAGQAEERFELAPRGFFEVGRRNLFGKNRSINLFTRVALRTRDSDVNNPVIESDYGFNEYRVIAAYREPRVFDTPADVLVTATLDQAIRSSFNFRSRELRAEAGLRFARHLGISGRYSFEKNELFDQRFTDEEAPLIDRLFPQVRLSKLSGSLFRDTRNDTLDPDRGVFLSADNDVALRAIGSEVGFVKTFLQASTFRRLPPTRRMVVRLRGIVGMARGFERTVERVENGTPITEVVTDLPASERFFAGGDTSVRGFSLDRLGTAETITPSGFPTGGNGLIVLNSELLVNVWRALDVVGFVDGGNVFPRASDLDVTDLRAAAGFGLRYRSPVGPIRIDLGFNLDPRELVPGTLERRSVLHVSLGQAF